jgi:DNA-binding CsgD family transcriptional regulator/predicted transcriptional regulator
MVSRWLSVFAGGCTLTAVKQVCTNEIGQEEISSSQILDLLSHLVDKSLVIVDEQSGETRYHMLETIRQYASEKLQESGEAKALQLRHADWFVNFAEHAEPELEGSRQTEWLDQLMDISTRLRTIKPKNSLILAILIVRTRFDSSIRREYANLRAALVWLLENDAAIALQLGCALGQFWEVRGHLFGEPIMLLERVLSTKEAPGQMTARAKALGSLGHFKYLQADYVGALSAYEKALALYQELNDKSGCANSLYFLGEIHASCRNETEARTFYIQARSYFLQSLVVLRGRGDKWREARSLNWLGEIARIDGDYMTARSYYEQSLAIQRGVSDETGIALSLFNLGSVTLHEGDYQEAATFFQGALALFQKLGRQRGVIDSVAFLAGLAGAMEQPERAARLFGAAEALHESHGTRIQHADRIEYDRSVGLIRTQLNDVMMANAWAEGRALTLEQAIEYALEEIVHPQTPRQAAKQEFGGLTEREHEVASHIAQGESNHEIAEALVVSERTVESHVTNILNKLGFTSRVQIRKWAVEKGIVKRVE